LATGNPAKFAILYSIGNILAFAAYRINNILELDSYLGLKDSFRTWLINKGEFVQLFMFQH
jgi:hypothetical protein